MPPALNPTIQRRRLTFGAVVRAKRKALGLSQEALAKRAGCDRQSINRVENAAYSPSLDRVFKLADALGLDLSDLFREFDRVAVKGAAVVSHGLNQDGGNAGAARAAGQ